MKSSKQYRKTKEGWVGHYGAKDVDAYIAKASKPAQKIMRQIRAAIKEVAPKATERISYRIPFYEYKSPGYKGRLAYFAVFHDHVSYFIVPGKATSGTFAKLLKPYRTGKSTLQFSVGTKVPVTLIKRTVKARIEEIEARKKKR